jgi:DNA-3-methyladenine glycosylase
VGGGRQRLTAVTAGSRAAAGLMPRDFFDRPAQEVAPELLGCVLEHETPDGLAAVALTEVEAYAGPADPASHAYRGRTARNTVMFGPPGHAYVYFTYGMHFCMNVVCMPPGTASAVLLRAGRVIAGEELARRRRAARQPAAAVRPAGPAGLGTRDPRVPVDRADGPQPPACAAPRHAAARHGAARHGAAARDLARGPARLCQALGIGRELNGADLCDPASPLRLLAALPREDGLPGSPVLPWRAGPRVGVREGADVPWRFWLDGEPTVSAYRPHVPRRR